MGFPDELKAALQKYVPADRLHFLDGWQSTWYRDGWAAGRPLALVLHHTAGAATKSTDPKNKGNQHGANQGQIDYVNRHPDYNMPCSAFTIDRDGCLYVNAAWPCYHAGEGSFTGTQWKSLGIPDDSANSYALGVEIVDKGTGAYFTAAMKESVALLAAACRDACGWPDTSTLRLPRHRDWAPDRKSDIVYENETVQGWIAQYAPSQPPMWDGVVPPKSNIDHAEDTGQANLAAYRLACRLYDLGYYEGTPAPVYQQGYPVKAVAAFQRGQGWEGSGKYGDKTHGAVWP